MDNFYHRLSKAVPANFKSLTAFRESTRKYVRDYSGTLYGGRDAVLVDEVGDMNKDILPLLRQAAESLVLTMASSRPRCIVRSQSSEHDAFSDQMKRALDAYSAKLNVGKTLGEAALDSYFGLGCIKVHMKTGEAVEVEADEFMEPGHPYIERISGNDVVFEYLAPGLRHAGFVGNKYLVDREKVINNPRYDEDLREQLREQKKGSYRNEGDRDTTAGLAGGENSTKEELFDKIWLGDIYVPSKKKVYTFCIDKKWNFKIPEPLQVTKWTGSENGCYFFLNLGPVPDNTLPSPPAQQVQLLHELVNTVYRKLEEQAEAQKELTVGPNADGEDHAKIAGAINTEHVELNNPHSITPIRFQGPDQGLFSFFINAREQFSIAAGNLDHKMGTGPSADTLGQESIIGQMVSRLESSYQLRYVEFVREVFTELARLLYNDPYTNFAYQREVADGISVDEVWYGADEQVDAYGQSMNAREGEFDDFLLDIDPYSLPYRPPTQKAAELKQMFFELLPAAPMLAQQGIQPDLRAFLEEMAKLNDAPELRKFFVYDAPTPRPGPNGQGQQQMQGGAPGGPKEYIHRNVSGGSEQGRKQEQMMQLLSNAGSNGDG